MTFIFNNHSIKFTFKNAGTEGDYFVLADGKTIGIVQKIQKNVWDAVDNDGAFVATRIGTGSRIAAGETLAVEAGLLDGNYNAI